MPKQVKEKTENEFRKTRQELHERERLLDKRQDGLDKQAEDQRKQEKLVESTQQRLATRIQDTNRRSQELEKLIEKERQVLHEFSGLSREEATEKLLQTLEKELHEETGAIIQRHEKVINDRCEMMTRNILLSAMQRYAASHTAESTTSTVDIPNDDMKGRIIGREGRNIRAFEKATGVDIIIDDTPGVVIVSGFDPVRREVARLALNRLIADGRIHPSRIEEIVAETNKDVQSMIQKAGTDAAHEVELFDLSDRVVNLLGRLHFRTSYSQNVLRHAVEVAFLSGMIAVELGMNEKLACRCGLLHDIGKAVDHEMEGGHPKIGADLLKRFGEPFEVIQAALGHHDDPRFDHPYTVIVATADACSASRPGARRESREADGGIGDDSERISGRGASLCGAGGPRDEGDAECGRVNGRNGLKDMPRHSQNPHRASPIPRRNQSHRHQRNQSDRSGTVDGGLYSFTSSISSSPAF